ncbi:MAG TPA: TMEM175 family protein [Croceibacterium sp.]|nr:TMEM175 family protein [Croceibacterium sp.]
MDSKRLEAFSDGVLAIIITIMVLELKVPHEPTMAALVALWPVFLSYVLSFLYVGIYWNNHHHMLAVTRQVNGGILWANLHLLFWLSLLPFSTGWMGENLFARGPTVLYGLNLLACALAYYLLEQRIIANQGRQGKLAGAVGRDLKGKLSPLFYTIGIVLAWLWLPMAGMAFFVLMALVWLVPDRRIERKMAD